MRSDVSPNNIVLSYIDSASPVVEVERWWKLVVRDLDSSFLFIFCLDNLSDARGRASTNTA